MDRQLVPTFVLAEEVFGGQLKWTGQLVLAFVLACVCCYYQIVFTVTRVSELLTGFGEIRRVGSVC